MSDPVLYPIAAPRRRAMYFNLACYGLVAVMAGGYWQGGAGSLWLVFALVGFVLFGLTLRMLTSRGFVARIENGEVTTVGPFGRPHAFRIDEMTAAGLDPQKRIGVIAYRLEGTDRDLYAPVSFRMMGAEGAADFVARVNELRPGLPPVHSPSTKK